MKRVKENLTRQMEENLDRRFAVLAQTKVLLRWEMGSHRSWQKKTPSLSPERDEEALRPDRWDRRSVSPRESFEIVPAQEKILSLE